MASFNSDDLISHILIIIAMEAEAKPFIGKYNLEHKKEGFQGVLKSSPTQLYQGIVKNIKYFYHDIMVYIFLIRVSLVTSGKCHLYGMDNVGKSSL